MASSVVLFLGTPLRSNHWCQGEHEIKHGRFFFRCSFGSCWTSLASQFKVPALPSLLKLPIILPVFSELPSNNQQLPNIPCPSFLRGSFISFLLASALTSSIPTPSPSDTYQNVPSTISGADKPRRIQKPNSAKAESCTRKCVATCIRGGGGAPGEGPLNVRKPLVVFKEEFRSRQYCLVECSEICNLIGERDDGP